MKIFFLVMLVYPGWQTISGPMTLEECHSHKRLRAATMVQTPRQPLIRHECIAHWDVPDKILWAF